MAALKIDGKRKRAIVEVNSETDFVARNEDFPGAGASDVAKVALREQGEHRRGRA